MKRKVLLLQVFIICVITVIGCSTSNNKSESKTIAQSTKELANFTLIISNQSFDKDNINIKVYIDKQLSVNNNFLVKGQHNYSFYYYKLPKGIHNISVESEDGAKLNKSFKTTDGKNWSFLTYWYSTGKNGEKVPPTLRINFSDKPIGLD